MATWAKAFVPGYKPPKPAGNYVGTGAAGAFKPKSPFHKPQYVANHAVPGASSGAIPGTFDPALDAQIRAAKRGEEDTLENIATEKHFGETDLKHALRNITTETKRGRQKLSTSFNRNTEDLGTDKSRGEERIGNQEADTQRNAGRQQEDLHAKIAQIGKQFADLGQRQGEAANAAGVNDAGTSAASAAARARNQIEAEAPIHTAEGRLSEDLATTLSRLGVSREQLGQDFNTKTGRLGQDYGTGISQLTQDRDRQREEANQEYTRAYGTGKPGGFIGLKGREAERTKREGAITPVDLLEQEIWEGKANHPGAYAAAGNKKKKGK